MALENIPLLRQKPYSRVRELYIHHLSYTLCELKSSISMHSWCASQHLLVSLLMLLMLFHQCIIHRKRHFMLLSVQQTPQPCHPTIDNIRELISSSFSLHRFAARFRLYGGRRNLRLRPRPIIRRWLRLDFLRGHLGILIGQSQLRHVVLRHNIHWVS